MHTIPYYGIISCTIFFLVLLLAVRFDLHKLEPSPDSFPWPYWLATFGNSLLLIFGASLLAVVWPVVLLFVVIKYSLDLILYCFKVVNMLIDWILIKLASEPNNSKGKP